VRQIAIVSGKGGTGKTSVAASLVTLAGRAVAADCDVDAADLAILMPGEDVVREPFLAGKVARIDPRACTACGECAPACRFGAIVDPGGGAPFRADPFLCEGCGVCGLVCELDAVSLVEKRAGEWMVRETATGPLVHARLGIAEDNSGKLVARVREEARLLAEERGIDLVVIDGPPGIGCPVHASVTGVDRLLVVTEPSPSGEHDLVRVLELAAHFGIPASVLVNKHDLAPEQTARIEELAASRGAAVAGRIAFDPEVPRALARGELPLVIAHVREALEQVLRRLAP
jgi:MinD superfamily P-loop ATPase